MNITEFVIAAAVCIIVYFILEKYAKLGKISSFVITLLVGIVILYVKKTHFNPNLGAVSQNTIIDNTPLVPTITTRQPIIAHTITSPQIPITTQMPQTPNIPITIQLPQTQTPNIPITTAQVFPSPEPEGLNIKLSNSRRSTQVTQNVPNNRIIKTSTVKKSPNNYKLSNKPSTINCASPSEMFIDIPDIQRPKNNSHN